MNSQSGNSPKAPGRKKTSTKVPALDLGDLQNAVALKVKSMFAGSKDQSPSVSPGRSSDRQASHREVT